MRKERKRMQLHRDTLRLLSGRPGAGWVLADAFRKADPESADTCDVGSCANPDRCCSGEATTCAT